MKHVIINSSWQVEEKPFKAFRVSMDYGINRKVEVFIPVEGEIQLSGNTLPQGDFQLIRRGGRLAVRTGTDSTNRCILMVGATGGFRGGVDVWKKGTTARVLMEVTAGNAIDSGLEVVALLEAGQSVATYSYGRRTDLITVYEWNGTELTTIEYTTREWKRKDDPPRSEDNVELMLGGNENRRIVSLCGNYVDAGVVLDTEAELSPEGVLAHTVGFEAGAKVENCRIGQDMYGELTLLPTDGAVSEDRVLVLVNEYSPGVGAKKMPSFYIDWDNAGDVVKLGSVTRSKGSGDDSYTIIDAPADWADDIAGQFVCKSGFGDQTIVYGARAHADTAGLPEELYLAFGADVERAFEFVRKVADLDPRWVDRDEICCGRKRVEDELIAASDDPDFLCGADPNDVKCFVFDFLFEGKHHELVDSGEEAQPEADDGLVDENDTESVLLQEIAAAFYGDEGKAGQFMRNLELLDRSLIDPEKLKMGRKHVRMHLQAVSGDPKFFLGANPNDLKQAMLRFFCV